MKRIGLFVWNKPDKAKVIWRLPYVEYNLTNSKFQFRIFCKLRGTWRWFPTRKVCGRSAIVFPASLVIPSEKWTSSRKSNSSSFMYCKYQYTFRKETAAAAAAANKAKGQRGWWGSSAVSV